MSDKELLAGELQYWLHGFVRRSMVDFIRYAKEHGLSRSQVGAMFQIHRRGSCSIHDIAGPLGISRAAASQLVDRMVGQGLVVRAEDPDDRRAKVIGLTDEGRCILEEGGRVQHRWLREFVSSLPDEDQVKVVEALQILRDHAAELGLVDRGGHPQGPGGKRRKEPGTAARPA